MTHLEIIMWVQENVIGLVQKMSEVYVITYIKEDGTVEDYRCTDIISGVLAINEKELVSI